MFDNPPGLQHFLLTQSYDKTIGNFDALAKITGSFAPEGNDALIFRESVLTS